MNFFYNVLTRKLDIGPDAGANITVTNGNTVNAIGGGSGTEGLYNAGPGLALSGSTFSAAPGYRMNVSSGTINQDRYFPIEVASGGSFTLQAGHYYQIFATSAAVTLGHETIPANQAGLEGHAEIFLANSSYIITDPNTTTITTPLIPDAVNNCTLRFHDGRCIITLEDHVFGYIVTTSEPAGSGSLAYALSTSPNEYIAFDAALNGLTLDMGGVATNGEKHIVGNGYTQTILSGSVSCTSKTTFSNLGMNGVSILGGTATLGDVYIPNGATVAVSGGGLAVEKVSGDGGVIDLGGGSGIKTANGANLSNASIVNGSGALFISGGFTKCESIVFSGNYTSTYGADCGVLGGSAEFSSCLFGDAVGQTNLHTIVYANGATITVDGCTIGTPNGGINLQDSASVLNLKGTNRFNCNGSFSYGNKGKYVLESGAILDLTGNTNATPIAPGGGITFEPGGATVLYGDSAGTPTSSAVITGATVASLDNAGGVYVATNGLAYNVTDSFVSATIKKDTSGSIYAFRGSHTFINCKIDRYITATNANYPTSSGVLVFGGTCSCSGAQAVYDPEHGATVELSDNCSFVTSGVSAILGGPVGTIIVGSDCNVVRGGTSIPVTAGTYHNAVLMPNGTIMVDGEGFITGNTRLASTIGGDGSVTLTSGAILDLTGNTNATPIAPGGGIVISSGGINIIDSAGTTHEFHRLAITGSTINNLSQILGATVSVPVSSGSLGPWIISTTLGSSTVSATDEAQEIVIDGGLVSIIEL